MDNNLLASSEDLLKRYDKIAKFSSKYQTFPSREGEKLYHEIVALWNSLPNIEEPKGRDELLDSELKRRLTTCWLILEDFLVPRPDTFERQLQKCGIPLQDLSGLQTWLAKNRDAALGAIDRLYETKEIEHFQVDLKNVYDIPEVKRKAIEFAEETIKTYHRELGQLVESLTEVGEDLQDIAAVPTERGYSYFWSLTDTLALDIFAICYVDEAGEFQLKEDEIIRLYGHEGMGHALNTAITENADLPYLLTLQAQSTSPVAESVAMFYMKQILKDLEESPETQQALGIESHFDEISRDVQDTELLMDYIHKLYRFSLVVLADTRFGTNPGDNKTIQERIQMINSVALDPIYGYRMVVGNLNNYSKGGDFTSDAVQQLKYCTGSVERALGVFEEHGIFYDGPEGRSLIDKTFLTGYWTAKGFEDNARLVAEEHSKKKKPQT